MIFRLVPVEEWKNNHHIISLLARVTADSLMDCKLHQLPRTVLHLDAVIRRDEAYEVLQHQDSATSPSGLNNSEYKANHHPTFADEKLF